MISHQGEGRGEGELSIISHDEKLLPRGVTEKGDPGEADDLRSSRSLESHFLREADCRLLALTRFRLSLMIAP